MQSFDLIIVGAGPAGLSCAIAAKQAGLKFLLCDKGNVVESIINFPNDMTFFSTTDTLEIAKIPFNSINSRPRRSEAIKYYHSLISYFEIPVQTRTTVTNIHAAGSEFSVVFENDGTQKNHETAYVVLATGFFDNPNLLNIPGESLPHVSHYYKEPYKYFRKKVVVVGGGNSAVEAALDLFRHGVDVTLVHRRAQIRESVKYWILPDIENRIREGSIKAYFNAAVQEISTQDVTVKSGEKIHSIPADAVFSMTGYQPDTRLLNKCGIVFDPESMEPRVKEHTLESNIPGIYIAGSLLAGRNTNRIFIENSREHGSVIINAIMQR